MKQEMRHIWNYWENVRDYDKSTKPPKYLTDVESATSIA